MSITGRWIIDVCDRCGAPVPFVDVGQADDHIGCGGEIVAVKVVPTSELECVETERDRLVKVLQEIECMAIQPYGGDPYRMADMAHDALSLYRVKASNDYN